MYIGNSRKKFMKNFELIPECELKTLLVNVPHSYKEFVIWMYHDAVKYNLEQIITDYIKSHPEDAPPTILEYMFDNHILPTASERHDEDEYVDDDEDDEELDDEDVQELLEITPKDELRTMLESVPGADDRFVVSVYWNAKQFRIVSECMDYIRAHTRATADEVLEFVDEYIYQDEDEDEE